MNNLSASLLRVDRTMCDTPVAGKQHAHATRLEHQPFAETYGESKNAGTAMGHLTEPRTPSVSADRDAASLERAETV